MIRSAERVIGCPLPPLGALFNSRALGKARKIMADPAHPGHGLFAPLPSGRRLRSLKTLKTRHSHSFFPTAIRLLNALPPPPVSPLSDLMVCCTQSRELSALWHSIFIILFIYICNVLSCLVCPVVNSTVPKQIPNVFTCHGK